MPKGVLDNFRQSSDKANDKQRCEPVYQHFSFYNCVFFSLYVHTE